MKGWRMHSRYRSLCRNHKQSVNLQLPPTTQTRKVPWCQKKDKAEVFVKIVLLSCHRIIYTNYISLACCRCNPQTCLGNDFPSEKATLLIYWEKNWVCTVSTSVNVYYIQIRNSHPCLSSCGNVILNQCIKDSPCVNTNYQVKCSSQKGFPLPNVFCHKCPGSNNHYSRRCNASVYRRNLCYFAHYHAYVCYDSSLRD